MKPTILRTRKNDATLRQRPTLFYDEKDRLLIRTKTDYWPGDKKDRLFSGTRKTD